MGGGDRGGGRRRGLLFGGLLLAALVAVALLLSQCGGSDPEGGSDPAAQSTGSSGSASADPSSSAGAPGSPAAPSGGSAGTGGGQVVSADGQSVLALVAGPDAATALAGLAGQPVTATGVRVLTVPADEGFWLGTSETERIWVQLTGEAGESPYQVQEGDLVDLEGSVVEHDAAFPGEVGVDDAEGAQQLGGQGAHLEVAKSSVRLAA